MQASRSRERRWMQLGLATVWAQTGFNVQFLSGLSIDGLKTDLELKCIGLVWGEEKRFGLDLI
jgi:hypothetical protein